MLSASHEATTCTFRKGVLALPKEGDLWLLSPGNV